MADNPNPNPAADPKYGELNDVSRPHAPISAPNDRSTSLASIAKASRRSYETNAIANVGQFKGIVLRVVKPDPQNPAGANEAGGWVSSFYGDKTIDTGILVEIKVRVPEIHSMLPVPTKLDRSILRAPGKRNYTSRCRRRTRRSRLPRQLRRKFILSKASDWRFSRGKKYASSSPRGIA